MYTIYGLDPQKLLRLRAAIPEKERVILTDDWEQVEYVEPDSRCSIILIDCLRTSPVVSRLSALKVRYPHHPVILVTRWDRDNARYLKNVDVEEVVWYPEVERNLAPAVQRTGAQHYSFLRRLADPLENAEHLPATLRKALAYACRSDTPVRSIKQLAVFARNDRRTLWHQWCKTVGPESPLRLQDFLHWVLLLRAVGKKTPGLTWAHVAEELGVHAHTLGRSAKQLTGRTLPELGMEGHAALVRSFRVNVLEMLIPIEVLDIL